MTSPLRSLINSGTKLWLDSIDPDLVVKNRELGATGATSNPIIIANLIKTGRWDTDIADLKRKGLGAEEIAWRLTDQLVSRAEEIFRPIYEDTRGNDGYVSFELDPLLEDRDCSLSINDKIEAYVALGKKWSAGHPNRMIKVPATPGGIGALEALAAHGINLNVTLLFTMSQYHKAREAVRRGFEKCANRAKAKSAYSIFVSRLDVYSETHVKDLGVAQGWLGIVNAKHIWQDNQSFWAKQGFPLDQEMIFASTGTKKPSDPPWKYVEALAGSDIQTNPPETNDAIEASGRHIEAEIQRLPSPEILRLIETKVDMAHMERVLMDEGLAKFAEPQKSLIKLIDQKISC